MVLNFFGWFQVVSDGFRSFRVLVSTVLCSFVRCGTSKQIERKKKKRKKKVSSCHPTFWKCLEVLQKEESIVRVRILQNQGHHIEHHR